MTDYRRRKQQLPAETVEDLRILYEEVRSAGRARATCSACGTSHPDASQKRVSRMTLDATCAALRDAGWTLDAIGQALDVTREAVRLWVLQATDVPEDWLPPIPSPPPQPQRPRKVRRPEMKAEFVAWLRETYSVATRCRGNHAIGSDERVASERLWPAIDAALAQGITASAVAKALGVGTGTIWAGLRRHGYRDNPPSQRSYIGEPNANQAAATSCKRGHPLSGENLRVLPRGQRICKACEAIRRQRYLARKHLRLVTDEEMAS